MYKPMVRPNAPSLRSLFYWFGAPIVFVSVFACSSYLGGDPLISNWFTSPGCPSNSDGSLAIPPECCPCPWKDKCPDGWPEVPEYCRTGCEPGEPHECCLCPTPEWCTTEAAQTYKPPDWCASKPWRDAGADASPAVCPVGTCVPKMPEGWLGPASLYTGFDTGVDPCPEGTTTWDGTAEPEALGCAECACSTPLSVCRLSPPWTISSHGCDDFDNGAIWNFDPPVDWDGTCNSDKALPAGKLCGSDFCVKSITIFPPILEQVDKSCTPYRKEDKPLVPKLYNGASLTPVGRVCIDKQAPTDLPTCGADDTNLCVSIPGHGPACIAHEGDISCPAAWPTRHIFYKHIEDNRSCSECSCGPIEGANCRRKYSLYTDSTCTSEYGSWTTYDKSLPQCLWINDGTAIGGKTLETIEDNLGACVPSGGKVVGDVKRIDPFTVCCVPGAM